jgi:predicted HicB family RNase H-like nuclease
MIANNDKKPRGQKPRISQNETGERMATIRMPACLHTRLVNASRGAKAKSLNAFAVEAIESAIVAVESEGQETASPPQVDSNEAA